MKRILSAHATLTFCLLERVRVELVVGIGEQSQGFILRHPHHRDTSER